MTKRGIIRRYYTENGRVAIEFYFAPPIDCPPPSLTSPFLPSLPFSSLPSPSLPQVLQPSSSRGGQNQILHSLTPRVSFPISIPSKNFVATIPSLRPSLDLPPSPPLSLPFPPSLPAIGTIKVVIQRRQNRILHFPSRVQSNSSTPLPLRVFLLARARLLRVVGAIFRSPRASTYFRSRVFACLLVLLVLYHPPS